MKGNSLMNIVILNRILVEEHPHTVDHPIIDHLRRIDRQEREDPDQGIVIIIKHLAEPSRRDTSHLNDGRENNNERRKNGGNSCGRGNGCTDNPLNHTNRSQSNRI